MRKKTLATLSAAGLLTTGLVAASTGSASAQTAPTTEVPQVERQAPVDRVGTALTDLVSSGVLTQEQADAVADSLAARHGQTSTGDRAERADRTNRGVSRVLAINIAAEVLGMERVDLAAELRAGTSLAELAVANGVDVDSLVDALVEVAQDRLAVSVEAGSIDADRGDRLSDSLRGRVEAFVNSSRDGTDRTPGERTPAERTPGERSPVEQTDEG